MSFSIKFCISTNCSKGSRGHRGKAGLFRLEGITVSSFGLGVCGFSLRGTGQSQARRLRGVCSGKERLWLMGGVQVCCLLQGVKHVQRRCRMGQTLPRMGQTLPCGLHLSGFPYPSRCSHTCERALLQTCC